MPQPQTTRHDTGVVTYDQCMIIPSIIRCAAGSLSANLVVKIACIIYIYYVYLAIKWARVKKVSVNNDMKIPGIIG